MIKRMHKAVQVRIRVDGQAVQVQGSLPAPKARMDHLLPMMRELDDRVIDIAVAGARNRNEHVSCSKGCSACCRAQPVPVTPPEAYALLLLVERLPEPRQSHVRAVFAHNVATLRQRGLAHIYLDTERTQDAAKATATARAYFALGLVCPFLESDACGIYDERPFVCRQYLVTSQTALCSDPFNAPVRPIRMSLRPASAMLEVVAANSAAPPLTVPLALALEYAQLHRETLAATYPAKSLLDGFMRALCASD
jgi:Fe-S-cluster containining protein